MTSTERALARLHTRIRSCTKCVEAGYLPSAFPIVAGKASDRVMIMWDGRSNGTLEIEQTNQEKIMARATGVEIAAG